MEGIKILNKKAFAACQAAQLNDSLRKYLTGVLIEPNGTVVGTNGHYMTYCPEVVEPFDGDAFILAAKQLTAAQYNADGDATIVLDGNKGIIEIYSNVYRRVAIKRHLIDADVIDGVFPKWREIVPTFKKKRKGNTEIAFNTKYAERAATIINKDYPQIFIEMNENNKAMLARYSQDKDDLLRTILMPITM